VGYIYKPSFLICKNHLIHIQYTFLYTFLFNIFIVQYGLQLFIPFMMDVRGKNQIGSLHWYQSFVVIPDFGQLPFRVSLLIRFFDHHWLLAI
jgi:hypothetical protein